tara:strand:+ start:4516 stop:4746 length:231 start_codon:yes stop_codon:yes gene_type:complete
MGRKVVRGIERAKPEDSMRYVVVNGERKLFKPIRHVDSQRGIDIIGGIREDKQEIEMGEDNRPIRYKLLGKSNAKK